MDPYILSIDAGTSGITVLVLNKQANICKKYYSEFNQYYPKPGWVEHNGDEIWKITKDLIHLAFNDYNQKYCKGIGITNQRETTIIWDKHKNQPIYNAIVWQCQRTKSICDKLKKLNYEKLIFNKTGLVIDSYFSATKIKWLLDNCKNAYKKAREGKLAFGTIDTWLLWKLTSGEIHATDFTNAARTQIFNINTMNWDKELLEIFNNFSNINFHKDLNGDFRAMTVAYD